MTSRPCAIFDLDGTLAETAPDLIGTANALMRAQGWPEMPLSEARSTAGFGAKALVRRGLDRAQISYDEGQVDALYQPFLDIYETRVADESHLFDGMRDALEMLAAEGWALGICTNKPEKLARMLMEKLDALHLFGSLIGADTLPVRKPDPTPLHEAIVRCGGNSARAVLVGDTDTDRKTARAAGIPCILTTFGYAPVPVADYAPEAIVTHSAEIPAACRALLMPG